MWPLAILVVLIASACREQPAASPPPSGGGQLLAAADEASHVVVGRVGAIERIDEHGYAAEIDVERVVRGDMAGRRVTIAWEELARGRPVRFRDGDRLLLALARLPDASIWDRRFPEAEKPLVVARGGMGFVRHPREVDVDLVSAYLSLPPRRRGARAGRVALVRMIAQATDEVARSALLRLQSTVDGGPVLDGDGLELLEQTVLDTTRPLELRSALISWAGKNSIDELRPVLERVAQSGTEPDAAALRALGVMDGGLERSRVEALLARSEARLRAVGARFARSALMRQRLAALIRSDPAPEVRAAAVTSAAAVDGIDAFADIAVALGDSDAGVRLSAVDAVARAGVAAAEPLEALAIRGTLAQATGAILALDRLHETGKPILVRLAVEHADPAVRRLALLALGKLPEHH